MAYGEFTVNPLNGSTVSGAELSIRNIIVISAVIFNNLLDQNIVIKTNFYINFVFLLLCFAFMFQNQYLHELKLLTQTPNLVIECVSIFLMLQLLNQWTWSWRTVLPT